MVVTPRWMTLTGDVDPHALPVIMCVWNRPHLLERTLSDLAAQQDAPPLRLMLWSNRPQIDAAVIAVVRDHGARGALSSVEFHSSRVNLGGIARFLAARHIFTRGVSRPFVMLDDDEGVSPRFVHDLLAAYRPRTFAGLWAFEIVSEYWDRRELPDGADAHYVGTGGSVCDSELVFQPGFFTRLPARFGFLEDIWASARTRQAGWSLKKVDTPFEFLSEADNQYHALRERKTEFWRLLTR